MSAACLMLVLVTLAAEAKGLHVGDRMYNLLEVWSNGAQGRLIFDDGALLYTKYPDEKFYILKDGVDEMVEDMSESRVNDLLLNSCGTVWVAHFDGLYEFCRQANTFTKISEIQFSKLTAAANGTIYGLEYDTHILYGVIKQYVMAVPWMKAISIAIMKSGDLYYSMDGLMRIRMAKGVAEIIRGLPAKKTWYLEIDRRDDILYICHDDGLYSVWPGYYDVEKIEGIEGPVLGIGFAPRGDIYVGNKDKILKMHLLA